MKRSQLLQTALLSIQYFKRFSLWGLATVVLFIQSSVFAQVEKFDPRVIAEFQKGERSVSAIVTLEPVPAPTGFWDELSPAEYTYHLVSKTYEAQERVRGLITEFFMTVEDGDLQNVKRFWTTNSIMMTATVEILWEIARLPEVTHIAFDEKITLDYFEAEGEAPSEYTYGLRRIGVPELRYEFPQLTGEGVLVGILDTGIDEDHPELKGKVVAWKDFINGRAEPYDDQGHGTHVAGTIAGEGLVGTQFGVAPRAGLIVGKILDGAGRGSLSGILRGMDWIANPEGKVHSNLRPRVVNNSWGGSRTSDARRDPFSQAVWNWVQLDIFPSFAAGNSGPGRDTIGSPGALPMAFAVGATDEDDDVARFSSRGPVVMKDMEGKTVTLTKPEISAPGARVYSTMPNGRYARLSGTSMATPHVTGAIALLYQARPALRVSDVIQILRGSALDSGAEGPDNHFGAGRMDILKAVQMLP